MTEPSRLERRLAGAPAVRAARAALAGGGSAWIVGGAVRDALRGVAVTDVDITVPDREASVARTVARQAGGHAFPLSSELGAWRVVAPDRGWHLDVVRLRAPELEADLAARDFTVNAIAVPLAGGPPLDPTGGVADLEAGLLRVASPRAFADDPLRLLRAARIAAAAGFEVEEGTRSLALAEAGRAAEPAGERQLAELRGIVAGPNPLRGLALMDDLGLTAVVLPEFEALRGITQTPYHQHDAHGHTIEVLRCWLEVERDPGRFLGPHATEARELLAEPLADELSRGEALRLAALIHDLGKPATRAVSAEGRVTFLGHDEVGAEIARAICRRLRASGRLADHLAALTLHHLRLGFLVHERPLPRRRVHEYLRATEPVGADVTLLTVADRLATRGERTKDAAISDHLDLAREMLGEALAWRREGPPALPIGGAELSAELGIEPGPELGRLLGEIEAAVFAGEVSNRDQAVELARRLLSEVD